MTTTTGTSLDTATAVVNARPPAWRAHLIPAWAGWAALCTLAMLALPGQETIPYHLGWAGFALAYGLATWQRWQLVLALAGYTLASGVVLARSSLVGNVEWQETNEIPLMFALALLMVWHVHRRQEALRQATVLAERDIRAAHDRERLMRLTSHELRTPLTIARGYVDLLQERATEPEDQQDLAVTADELERLSRVSDRLIRMIRLQDDTVTEDVDLDHVLAQAVERWRIVADRNWVLRTRLGHCQGSSERLRTCLDTLIENALRYTEPGDTIRLIGVRREAELVVAVLDSGSGLTDHQIMAINAGEQPQQAETPLGSVDRLAGTGLGLGIVRQIAHARGGSLYASRSPEGGAALSLTFPIDYPIPPVSRLSVPDLLSTRLPRQSPTQPAVLDG
ncbi:MAG TPA: HAMP domain-containing sensor histidine kinase [Angustibacter sp.]|nr:HAMP domain-containing sensor histidine kinase [Angustibacter sp.]